MKFHSCDTHPVTPSGLCTPASSKELGAKGLLNSNRGLSRHFRFELLSCAPSAQLVKRGLSDLTGGRAGLAPQNNAGVVGLHQVYDDLGFQD